MHYPQAFPYQMSTDSLIIRFHADKLSSAHIYLRMNDGETWDAIPQDLLTDCAQLTKANSIEGQHFSPVTCFNMILTLSREQERQCHSHLHALVKPKERRKHGSGSGFFQRSKKGRFNHYLKVLGIVKLYFRSKRFLFLNGRIQLSIASIRPKLRNCRTCKWKKKRD